MTYNGANYSGLKLFVANSSNAYMVHFEDTRALAKIGDINIGITEAQAKAIAEQYVKDSFTYPQDYGNGTVIFVNGLNVVDENTTARLATAGRYDSALYPCWDVHVALDQVYPGSVTAVNVRVWAGDGVVYSARTESAYNPDWFVPPVIFSWPSLILTLIVLTLTVGVVIVVILVAVLKKTQTPQTQKSIRLNYKP